MQRIVRVKLRYFLLIAVTSLCVPSAFSQVSLSEYQGRINTNNNCRWLNLGTYPYAATIDYDPHREDLVLEISNQKVAVFRDVLDFNSRKYTLRNYQYTSRTLEASFDSLFFSKDKSEETMTLFDRFNYRREILKDALNSFASSKDNDPANKDYYYNMISCAFFLHDLAAEEQEYDSSFFVNELDFNRLVQSDNRFPMAVKHLDNNINALAALSHGEKIVSSPYGSAKQFTISILISDRGFVFIKQPILNEKNAYLIDFKRQYFYHVADCNNGEEVPSYCISDDEDAGFAYETRLNFRDLLVDRVYSNLLMNSVKFLEGGVLETYGKYVSPEKKDLHHNTILLAAKLIRLSLGEKNN